MNSSSGSDGLSTAATAKYSDVLPGVPTLAGALGGTQAIPNTEEAHRSREMGYRIATRLMLGDLVVAFAAVFLGLQTRAWQVQGIGNQTLGGELQMVAISAAGALIFSLIMAATHAYEVRSLYRMNHLVKAVIKSCILWCLSILAAVGFLHNEGYNPQISLLFAVCSLGIGIISWRMAAFAWMLKPEVRSAASSRIVMVGWNDKAFHLRDAMHRDLSQLGEIVGCVPAPGGRFSGRPPADVTVLGDYSDLPNLIRNNQVDTVILADMSCPPSEIHHLIAFCQREYVGFQMIPEYFSALNSGLRVQTVSGVPLLGVSQLPLDNALNRAIKRGVDIVGALIGLGISAMIIPWFCLLVYIESPGPVIYRQKRTSRGGRNFFIYKIRSMKLNAETGTGAVWCKKEDDRRLKIGTFMRKTNIDELPQFWNVLKGDMSLVGPRPERPELIEKFKHEIPNYNVRHKVRAGLTGWAAINGWRGDTDLRKRVEADIYYLENWSVFLDLYCIIATCFKIKNAH
ncbi:MAG: exopolysaccharide biosynthesis polyprenyl glycosylphosphotransferase [Opitutaceae bacterium]|nr:exopolysaccharide biosynthesis polyprenyl glycosylphosphotransferase [Opitutaceae bacterium]